MRKGLCIIICALLLISCNVHVFADEVEPLAKPADPGISPMMEYIARSTAKISADENGLNIWWIIYANSLPYVQYD